MATTEPANAAGRIRSPALWRAGALLLVVGVLFITSYLGQRTERMLQAGASTRSMMEASIRIRQAYALSRLAATPEQREATRDALRDLQKLTDAAPSALNIRRAAAAQYALGDPAWKSTLVRLRTQSDPPSPFATERELDMWRRALETHPAPGDAATLRTQIERLHLGWYENLALEGMYRNAGLEAEARARAGAALRSVILLVVFSLLALTVGIGGILLLLPIGLYWLGRWRRPQEPASPILEKLFRPEPISPLERPKAEALYSVFLIYLVTFAALRLVVGPLLRAVPGASALSATASALLSLVVSLVAMGVPLLALMAFARQTGMRSEDVGLRTRSFWVDVAWGVGGYMVALPLAYVTTLLSSAIFRGVDTPLHPALAEFAGSSSLVYRLLLLTQAVVMAPLLEEFMFRGIFYGALWPRIGRLLAVVLASGVFAILHPQLPLGFLGLFSLGLLFNALYIQRGSLLPGIVAHALNNGMIFLLMTLLFGP